ncbi:class I adenylate-forming enzyme family protein [Streptomyces sp. NPDC002577]
MLSNQLDSLPDQVREALTGPGGPFELTTEEVRGVKMTVFARRAPNLPALLTSAAQSHPDRDYLVFPGKSVSYGETVHLVPRIAGLLRDRFGVGPGDRVALAGANSLEHALTLWAVLWLGAVVVGLNGWWTGDELREGIDLTAPLVLLGDERRLARLEQKPGSRVAGTTFTDCMPGPGADVVPPAEIDEDDAASILFTSGTTGRSKGAVITHRGLVNYAMDAKLRGAIDAALSRETQQAPGPAPVMLLASPLFHISGIGPLLANAPSTGMTLVFPPEGRWDPGRHLELTARYGVTSWTGVPTQLIRLLRHPDVDRYDLRQVRSVGFGGAPLPAALAALLVEKLPHARVAGGYGMSETCGLGTATSGARLLGDPRSAGPATPTCQVVLRDAEGNDIPDRRTATHAEEYGEICIRTPSCFLGYWDDGPATAAALDTDGWYHTGDYGRIADGVLYLESRMRDLIIRGGENIYPVEIENRLTEHPGLLDAAVIGVPHEELGQEVMAVVVPCDTAAPSAAEVRSWVAQKLAPFKVPSQVRFVSGLPYSPTGKLLKRELEQQIAAAQR